MVEFEALLEKARACDQDVWIAGATNEAEVARLERYFAIKLPPSYKHFLLSMGALAVHASTVSGIIDGNALDESGGSLYGDTVRFRREFSLPTRLLVLQADDDAPHCFDCESANAEGELAVVCFEVASGTVTEVAPSFGRWIERFIFNEGI